MTCPQEFGHIPVMLSEVIQALACQANDLVLDATFGRGGYCRALLAGEARQVIAFDRDPEAARVAARFSQDFGDRFAFHAEPFSALCDWQQEGRGPLLDGMVFDLGLSSPQVDTPERGFSFMQDGPLDMRMGGAGPTAAELVNQLEPSELADLIFYLGEERKARQITKAIVSARQSRAIKSTSELAGLVSSIVPRRGKIHPATKTFQALRLAVNDELGELVKALNAAGDLLKPGGRLVVVSFHSLEDRLIKQFLRGAEAREVRDPVTYKPLRDPSFLAKPRKAVVPTAAEIKANPRSRSARLRMATRTEAPFFPQALTPVWTRPDLRESRR